MDVPTRINRSPPTPKGSFGKEDVWNAHFPHFFLYFLSLSIMNEFWQNIFNKYISWLRLICNPNFFYNIFIMVKKTLWWLMTTFKLQLISQNIYLPDPRVYNWSLLWCLGCSCMGWGFFFAAVFFFVVVSRGWGCTCMPLKTNWCERVMKWTALFLLIPCVIPDSCTKMKA